MNSFIKLTLIPEQQTANRNVELATDALVAWFGQFDEVIVAFSGGVDSSVVLAAAIRSDAERVTAITAVSPSVASWQIDLAKRVASDLGADHRLVETDELAREEYVANDSQRCFHCKSTLYDSLAAFIETALSNSSQVVNTDHFSRSRKSVIVSGTNADDLGDHRPGIEAGRIAGVKTPLAELGYDKTVVREIASGLGLSNADLPASPCLASRIAYGVEVTLERLKKVERAEAFLRELGYAEFRVRLHEGELARIEVPESRIGDFAESDLRQRVVGALQEIGFRYVAIDLQGFSSGSLNRQLVSLGTRQD